MRNARLRVNQSSEKGTDVEQLSSIVEAISTATRPADRWHGWLCHFDSISVRLLCVGRRINIPGFCVLRELPVATDCGRAAVGVGVSTTRRLSRSWRSAAGSCVSNSGRRRVLLVSRHPRPTVAESVRDKFSDCPVSACFTQLSGRSQRHKSFDGRTPVAGNARSENPRSGCVCGTRESAMPDASR